MAYFQYKTQVNGSALFLAIVVSLLIGLMSGFFLLASYLHNLEIDKVLIDRQLASDAQSGMVLLLSGKWISDSSSSLKMDLFGTGEDSVQLKLWNYGVFQVAVSKAWHSNISRYKVALLGTAFDSMNNTAVYFPDQYQPLALAGNTYVAGDAYLPAQGVKASAIENKPYLHKTLIYGKIKHSDSRLPDLNEKYLKANYKYLEGKSEMNDSIVSNAALRDTITNSFLNKRLIFKYNEFKKVDNRVINGNASFYSAQGFIISAKTNVSGAVFYAPYIIVEKGFKGDLQLFATDSIIIQQGVTMDYPSAIVLYDKKVRKAENSIRIGDRSSISGFIFLKDSIQSANIKPHLYLSTSTNVYGTVYCDGISEINGNIIGSVFFNKQAVRTVSYYENDLLNVNINNPKLSKYFVNSMLMGLNENKAVVKWLE